jgi:hypothetical protein
MSEVKKWLTDLGLEQYVVTFEENDIDWDVLPELDHESLKDLGVSSTGHTRTLVKLLSNAMKVMSLGTLTMACLPNLATQLRTKTRQNALSGPNSK